MPVYEYQGQHYDLPDTDPALAKQKILAYLAKQQPPSRERTYGEALQDIGAGLVGGIGSLVQLPGQLYGLATGDMRRTGALGVGKDIEEYAETLKSAGLKAREEARRKAIEEATAKEGQFGAFKSAFSETVKDPALLLTFLAEQAPQLLVPFGAAKIAKGATAARGAGEVAAAQAGVRGAVGAAGVQQGADVGAGAYENIYAELKSKGASDKEAAEGALNLARAAGASGAIISLLAQRLPGAKALEETFAGVPGTTGRAARVTRGALGESAGEITEEVGGRFGQNLAMREVKPEQSLTEGLGETAGMAAIGGGLLGGVAGLARRPQPPEAPVIEPPPPPPITSPEQQRIEQTTGVERPAAVGIEGLLSAEEAERQRIARLRERSDEAARQQAERARTEGVIGETQFPVSVPETPRFEPEPVTKTSEELAAQQAEVDRRRQEAGLPTAAQQRAGITEVEKPKIAQSSPVPKLVDPRPLTEQQANARLGVLRDMLSIEGGDPNSLGIVPHPTVQGKFAIKSFDLPFKLSAETQATAFGTPEKPVVIDPVEAYVNIARQTNTPAAKRFVKDWEAGRIPREDVQRALQTERQLLSLPPLTFLGSPGAKISQQPIAGPTLQGVRDVFDKPVTTTVMGTKKPYDVPTPSVPFSSTTWNVSAGQVEPTSNLELPAIQFLNNPSVDPVDYYIRMLTNLTNIDPASLTTNEEKAQYQKIKTFLEAYNQNKIPRSFIENALKRTGPTGTTVTEQPPTQQPPTTGQESEVLTFEEFKKRMPVLRQNAEVEAANLAGDLKKLGDALAKSSNPAIARVGELTNLIVGKVTLKKPRRLSAGVAGQYAYADDSIQMDRNYAGDEHTSAHEIIHGLIAKSQRFPGPKQMRYAKDLQTLYEHVRKELNKQGMGWGRGFKTQVYGLLNEREFASEAMTNQEFQYMLMKIPYKGKKSAWSQFVSIVANLLGIKDTNALSEAMLLIENLAKAGRPLKTPFDPSLVDARVTAEQVKEKAKQALQKRGPLKLAPQVTGQLAENIKNQFALENKTIIDKIEGLKDRFWQRMSQGIADQFRSIKEYDEKAYMQARLSKSVDGGLEGLLFYGEVYNDDGALNIRKDGKGLIKALEPVGTEVDNFMIWIALNREEQLRKAGKIPSISNEILAEKDTLSSGTLNGQPRLQVYNRVLEDMKKLNGSVLKIALDTGLIDQKGYERFSEDNFYVPFYKEMEGKDIDAPSTASGLTSQYFSKQLKGGEKPFGDLVENTLRNWNHILSAAMKNQAAVSTIQSASTFKLGDTPVVEPTTEKTGSAKIMVDGQAQYFKINDPLLFEAISAIGYLGPKSKFLDVARDFKNILQFGVTLSPAFKVNNLIRDSVSAMAVTELNKNPIANVLNGVSIFNKDDPTYISALAGGAIFNFGTAYEGDQSKLIKRLIEKGINRDTILDTPDRIRKGLRMAWDKYQDWGNASEAANRLALYKQLRDKGMSHLEATYQARDLLDFSMQGSWPAFRLVTQVVPFMNARIQGLYKLGRDGVIPTSRVLYNVATGKEIEGNDKQKAEAFGLVTGAVMLASMALYLTFKDDEEYQKRDEWDRDNFWWFKLPGMDVALRVPKPFEIGAFGTLTERILEQVIDEGAEGKQFTDALTRMLGDTFALNPTPQMVKPLLDLYANKDSFTGAPIESAGLERLSKQERVNDNTSALAIALGGISTVFPEKFQLSPVQVDYAIKGYFGWLGGLASTTSTYAVMPFKEGAYPDTKWIDRASLGLARDLPSNQARYVTAFYENGKEINQAYADMRHYAEVGDAEKVEKILEEKGDKIALAKFYDKTAKNMSEIRKQIRVIMADTTMDGAAKREEIDRMKMIIAELAKQAEEARKSFK